MPLTSSTEISFGVSFRKARRRHRRVRGAAVRRWAATVVTAASCVVAGIAPIATVVAAPELGRLGAVVWPSAPAPVVESHERVQRPVLRARNALVTTVREEPPALQAHVVAAGETLLSIAARYGVTPQTLAYNNALADTADLREGRSLVVPPFDAAIHVVRDGETVAEIAARFGVDADEVLRINRVAFEPADVPSGRPLLLPVPDGRYPGFRLRVSEAPRVFAPRVRWPTEGVVTQIFGQGHTGVDIAAPHGSPIVASDAGTVTAVGWRGPGGLSVCVHHDWGLETCAYHAAAVHVEVGERVTAGQRIASVGSSGLSSGAHVHWEARTNGVLVDPMTYAPQAAIRVNVGGATGSR